MIVARDEISDRLQIAGAGTGPADPQRFAEFFLATRATSSSLAKSVAIGGDHSRLNLPDPPRVERHIVFDRLCPRASSRERSVLSASRSSASSVCWLSLGESNGQ
jgi:hypothetical protein